MGQMSYNRPIGCMQINSFSGSTVHRIQVKVKPNSKVSLVEEQPDGTWIVRVKATPVDGKANQEVIEVVAKHFGVAKRDVVISVEQRQKQMDLDRSLGPLAERTFAKGIVQCKKQTKEFIVENQLDLTEVNRWLDQLEDSLPFKHLPTIKLT